MNKKQETPKDKQTTVEYESAARFLDTDKTETEEVADNALDDTQQSTSSSSTLLAGAAIRSGLSSNSLSASEDYDTDIIGTLDEDGLDALFNTPTRFTPSEEADELAYHWYFEMLNSAEFKKGSAALIVVGLMAIALSTCLPGVLGTVVLAGGVCGVGLGAAGVGASLFYGFFKPVEPIHLERNESITSFSLNTQQQGLS